MDKQPDPVPNGHPHVVDLVTADLAARKAHGVREYGTPLQPWNGRDPLVDSYEEALDLAVYLRQDLHERATLAPLLDELMRAAKAVCDGVTDELAGPEQRLIVRLRAAWGAYGSAHMRAGLQPPIPDPNEGYDHRRSMQLAREAMRTHPRDGQGRLTTPDKARHAKEFLA